MRWMLLNLIATILFTMPAAVAQNAPKVDALGDPLPEGAFARLGTTRFRCLDPATLVLFPDDSRLAAVNWERTVSVVEVKTGKELLRVGNATDGIYAVAISRDSRLLTTASEQGLCRWDAATGNLLGTIKSVKNNFQDYSYRFAMSPDGETFALAKGKGNSVRVYSARTGMELHWLSGGARVQCMVYSRDSKMLAVGDENQPATVQIWDVTTGKNVQTLFHAGETWIKSLAFSPDGTKVAVGGVGRMRIFLIATGAIVLETSGPANAVVFSTDGKRLATSGSNRYAVRICDAKSGQEVRRLIKDRHAPHKLYFSQDSSFLVSAGSVVAVWDCESGSEVTNATGHCCGVGSVAFSRDGFRLASVDSSAECRVWERAEWRTIFRCQVVPPHTAFTDIQIAFSPDQQQLAVAAGWLTFIDIASGKKKASPQKIWGGNRFEFSPKGDQLAVGSDGCIELFEMPIAKPPRKIDIGAEARVRAVAYSGDGLLLASGREVSRRGQDDGSILQVWDVKTNPMRSVALRHDRRGMIAGISGIAYSMDGKFVAWHDSTPTGIIRLQRATSNAEPVELIGHGPGKYATSTAIQSIAFSPDCWLLVSGGDDRTIRVWEVLTGQMICVYSGHRGAVTSLAYSSDSNRFASGSTDSTVLIWKSLREQLSEARQKFRRPLPILERAWAQLRSSNAQTAYEGITTLVGARGNESVSYIRSKLETSTELNAEHIGQLIGDLDSPDFRKRDAALTGLRESDERVVPFLEAASRRNLSQESRRRIEILLASISGRPISQDKLQSLRAVQTLEWIGSEGAKQVLAELAKGPSGTFQTEVARSALARLSVRP